MSHEFYSRDEFSLITDSLLCIIFILVPKHSKLSQYARIMLYIHRLATFQICCEQLCASRKFSRLSSSTRVLEKGGLRRGIL